MAKGYWISTYRAIRDADAVAAYSAAAGPAIRAHGGMPLAAGTPAYAFDLGETLRTVLIEFPASRPPTTATRAPSIRRRAP